MWQGSSGAGERLLVSFGSLAAHPAAFNLACSVHHGESSLSLRLPSPRPVSRELSSWLQSGLERLADRHLGVASVVFRRDLLHRGLNALNQAKSGALVPVEETFVFWEVDRTPL